MIYLYAARNFSTLVGLASPEPLSNMYDATYFRATWVLTALDAGFWTAMKIRTPWLRDLASIVFSGFYLIAAEQADEKVRKVRGNLTVDHLRVSWNKGRTPYLRFLQNLLRPRFTRWPPRAIRIPRPRSSDYYPEPVNAWLYFDGPLSALEHHSRIILDIPGGGFVAMDPRVNDDKLFAWAGKTGLPVLSLDYKKAPEYPYPYALNECFDVYQTIIKSRGRCIGLSGREVPRIVVTGDSAGGNLATAMVLMVLESGTTPLRKFRGQMELPPPDGVVLFYPALDMNIGSWMSDEQMALIKDRRTRTENKMILRRKSMQYTDLVGTPHQSDDEGEGAEGLRTTKPVEVTSSEITAASGGDPRLPHPEYAHQPVSPVVPKKEHSTSHHPAPMKTRLAMSSMISYFNDRILTPEMMRAMIILYIGPVNRPDFSQDYLLSPILAPDMLLEKFPKTYFLTGERDPLVDDTVIFAGRLRQLKARLHGDARTDDEDDDLANDENEDDQPRKDRHREPFNPKDAAEVFLIPGISHGFIQFPAIYPPAWKLIHRSANWMLDAFDHADQRREEAEAARRERIAKRKARAQAKRERQLATAAEAVGEMNGHANGTTGGKHHYAKHLSYTNSSGEEDRPLEMMTMTRARGRTLDKMSESAREGQLRHAVSESAVVNGESGLGGGGVVKWEDRETGHIEKANGLVGPESDEARKTKVKAEKERKAAAARRRAKASSSGDRSLVKLNSSDDLLGRRMQGLAGGLTRVADDD